MYVGLQLLCLDKSTWSLPRMFEEINFIICFTVLKTVEGFAWHRKKRIVVDLMCTKLLEWGGYY